MKYTVATSFYQPIFDETAGPFVSIYLQTTPYIGDRNKYQIKLKNKISELKEHHPHLSHVATDLTTLNDDFRFWDQLQQGLAILISPTQNVIYFLENPVRDSLTVGDRLYILPLIRHFQQLTEVQLLLLNREEFTLYQGTYHRLHKMDYPKDKPMTKAEVLGTDTTQRFFTYSPLGHFQGDDGKATMISVDTARYFNYVDNYIYENISKVSKIPLVLVALPEYHSVFREISHNEYLLEEGIKMDFSKFSTKTLETQLENLMYPQHRKFLREWADRFRTAQANGLGTDFVDDVVNAVMDNRVETLFINRDRPLNGTINLEEHAFTVEEASDNDLRNELAILALKAKSRILVLDEDEMPAPVAVACITRY